MTDSFYGGTDEEWPVLWAYAEGLSANEIAKRTRYRVQGQSPDR